MCFQSPQNLKQYFWAEMSAVRFNYDASYKPVRHGGPITKKIAWNTKSSIFKGNRKLLPFQLAIMVQQAYNLCQLLSLAASTSDAGITVYQPGAQASTYTTCKDLFQRARANAKLIQQIEGRSPQSKILLYFDQHLDCLEWFWAVIVAGYVPMISPPLLNDHVQREKHLLHLEHL